MIFSFRLLPFPPQLGKFAADSPHFSVHLNGAFLLVVSSALGRLGLLYVDFRLLL